MKDHDDTIQRLNKELAMLAAKLQDLEGFEEAVVNRELRMMEVERENERLRTELQQLKNKDK